MSRRGARKRQAKAKRPDLAAPPPSRADGEKPEGSVRPSDFDTSPKAPLAAAPPSSTTGDGSTAARTAGDGLRTSGDPSEAPAAGDLKARANAAGVTRRT